MPRMTDSCTERGGALPGSKEALEEKNMEIF